MNGYNPDRLSELDAMRMGTDYRMSIKLRNFNMPVRPLAMSEQIQIHHNVADYLSKLPNSARTSQNEHYYAAREYLKMASTSDVGQADVHIGDPVLDKMTVDEVMHLYRQYIQAVDKANPSLEMMSADEITAIVDDIKKKAPDELGLAVIELSFLELVNLVQYFVTKKD